MAELLLFFFICAFVYGYYRLCKWLTYDFFTTEVQLTGDWKQDKLYPFLKKSVGVMLLLPFGFIIIAVLLFVLAAAGGNNKSSTTRTQNSYRDNDDDDGYYKVQVFSNSSKYWRDVSVASSESAATTRAIDHQSRHPGESVRVVRVRKNGKIVSTSYSS
jgi:hypothetical protein